MKKRLLAIVMTMAMALSLLPVTALADGADTGSQPAGQVQEDPDLGNTGAAGTIRFPGTARTRGTIPPCPGTARTRGMIPPCPGTARTKGTIPASPEMAQMLETTPALKGFLRRLHLMRSQQLVIRSTQPWKNLQTH